MIVLVVEDSPAEPHRWLIVAENSDEGFFCGDPGTSGRRTFPESGSVDAGLTGNERRTDTRQDAASSSRRRGDSNRVPGSQQSPLHAQVRSVYSADRFKV